MATMLHTSNLGDTENVDVTFAGPCGAATPTSFEIASNLFGPFGAFATAVVSSGTAPPGVEPLVCPTSGASRVWMAGTPTAIGVYTYTVHIVRQDATTLDVDIEQTIALAGGCPLITITPSTLDDILRSDTIAIPLAAADGVGPYVWDVPPETPLPDGLALSSGGVLSGAATAAGVYTFTVRATDTNGCPGVISYTLTVIDPDPVVVLPSDATLEPGARQALYGLLFTAEAGTGAPYAFTITAGALPAGLTLDADGSLVGIPRFAGLYAFTVRATDAGGNVGERAYTLHITGLRIVIGGEDITEEVASADLELGLNRQATGSLEVGDDYIPARGADAVVYKRDGITPLFGGIVLQRRVLGMSPSNPANKANVDLVDNTIFFDDADPVTIVSAVTQDLEDVIAAIVAQSLAVYGFTYDAAPTGQTVPPIEWREITVPDAFKRITDATGVVFRERPIKALEVFVPLADAAPVTITDANINAFDLTWSDPPGLAKNTVDLTCGPTGNGIADQHFTADGIVTSWEVDIQAVLGNAQPARRANAYLAAVGATNFDDGDTIGAGSSTYTFRTALVGDVAGEVLIGATVVDSLGNLNAAINLAGGGNYAPSTAANADVSSQMPGSTLEADALIAGAAGNAIPVTSSHEAIAFWFGEGSVPLSTLQLGADATGVAGWTQGYVLENGGIARTISRPVDGDGYYFWDVTAGRGTLTIGIGTPPIAGTDLELKYLAVYPFHARVTSGSPPRTFREDHPEIIDYAAGLALATTILARESADRRALMVDTDVEGFLPGQALDVDTTQRGGIDALFLIGTVLITLINAEMFEYEITGEQSDEYGGSFVDQWKALTSGGKSSAAAPATLVDGGAAAAGDIYSDGRQSFRADQSLGGHKLTFVDDPASATDAATKGSAAAGDAATLAAAEAYADAGDAAIAGSVILEDGSVPFSGPESMGGNALTDVDDPTNPQDAATKAYVDAAVAGGGGGGGGGGLVPLAEIVCSGTASADFTTRTAPGMSGAIFQSDYDEYLVELINLVPSVVATTRLNARMSSNGGSSWVSTASYYDTIIYNNTAGASGIEGHQAITEWFLHPAFVNASSGQTLNGRFWITNPLSAAAQKTMDGTANCIHTVDGIPYRGSITNWLLSLTAMNAIQFYFNAGTILTGILRISAMPK